MINNESVTIILLTVVFAVVFFILMRSVNLWYWKINTLLQNQEKQIALLNLGRCGKDRECRQI